MSPWSLEKTTRVLSSRPASQRPKYRADFGVHHFRKPAVCPAVQSPIFFRPMLADPESEPARVDLLHAIRFALRRLEIRRQRRALLAHKLLARHAFGQFHRLPQKSSQRPFRDSLDGHKADVVRVDERRHKQKRFVVLAAKECGTRVGQARSLVLADAVEPDLLERHRQMHLAAVGRFVTGASEDPAQRPLQNLDGHLLVDLRVLLQADAAGHHAGHHGEPRRHADRVGAIGPLEPRTAGRKAVHRRRLQVLVPRATQHVGPLLVGEDKQDVGAF